MSTASVQRGPWKRPLGRPGARATFFKYPLAATAANRSVVHQDAAGAAILQHAVHAFAAGLDHLTALGVAAGAGDAHAVLGHLTLADPHGEVAAANDHAVHHAAATAHAAGEHRAQVLHHAGGHLVVAVAGDLHSARALLHLE